MATDKVEIEKIIARMEERAGLRKERKSQTPQYKMYFICSSSGASRSCHTVQKVCDCVALSCVLISVICDCYSDCRNDKNNRTWVPGPRNLPRAMLRIRNPSSHRVKRVKVSKASARYSQNLF